MAKDSLLNKFLNSMGISEGTTDAFSDLLGNLMPKPKKFKPSDPGYNDAHATGIKDEDEHKLMDLTRRIPEGRRVEPPPYYEYVDYPHRMDFNGYSLRIGDCCFVLPPEFISIKTNSTTDTRVTIRQENTTKIRHGYARREIVVTMFFNGYDQINGFEVESPFPYKYYVDGLRPLIAQFKCTPFLPIQNEFINDTHGIHNVGLTNIAVSVVPGFPDCLEVTLVMQEFNVDPYIEMPGMFFDDFIDWDLFRFYYQQYMRKGSGIINYLRPLPADAVTLTGNFEFFALKPEALTTSGKDPKQISQDLYDEKSFNKMVSHENNVTISEMQFGMSNIMPSLQLSDHETPTMQYLGGMDTTFNFAFQTTDRSVIASFQTLHTITQALTRGYRDYCSLGFVKINNELVALTGTQFLMVDNITVNTVPEYPDLFDIQIQCVSFDQRQDDKENLTGFRPFDRQGTKKDGISQDKQGLLKKITQDNYIEQALLNNCELYPDLHLPTYDEINSAITSIREFRQNKGLEQIGYTEYPKEVSLIPGKGPFGVYSKYVDPDFYVFYPTKYVDLDVEILKKYHQNKQPVPNSIKIPNHDYGDEIPDGASTDAEGNLIYDTSGSGAGYNINNPTSADVEGFLQMMLSKEGCGYIWGADGQTLTQEFLSQKKREFGASHYNYAYKWMGKQVFDCSGFVSWGMRQMGVAPSGYRLTVDGIMADSSRVERLSSKNSLIPGDLVANDHHIAIFIGNDQTIEAMGSEYGVVKGNVGNRFSVFGRIKGLGSAVQKATIQESANVSSSSGNTGNAGNAAGIDSILRGSMAGYGSTFVSLGNQYGVDPALMASIVMQETGGTSSALRNYNNPAGIMDWENNWQTLRHFSSLSEGLKFSFKNLKGIIDSGKTTIEAIGSVYCPVGASNDPRGLNKEWVPAVKSFYARATGGGTYASDGTSSGGGLGGFIRRLDFKWSQTNAGKTVGDKTGQLDISKFGKPVYFEAHDNDTLLSESLGDNQLNRMTVDMCTFSARGRLLRAFPTYLFLIVDDSGEWLDGQKLWSNYYIYKSVLNLSIFQEDSQPVHTATVTVSNAYSNLTRAPKMANDFGKPLNTDIGQDKDYNWFSRAWYNMTGSLLGTPKLTQDMVDIKNMIWETAAVKPGCRIHIRMGYGSNPLSLPVNFNGVISDIDVGDVVTVVAQSDGAELINDVISTDKKAKNGITKLQSEPSDVIASLLRERNNIIANALSKDWGEPSKYGIEHFGLYSNEGLFGNLKGTLQYDLCKNIYLGKYGCQHYTDGKWLADGEDNINFNIYNKTPWDCMQIVAQFLPEFYCQPIYHQFESRVFYGLGTWPAKFRYDYDADKGKVYETAKSFIQIHVMDSVNDIIDNQIKVSTHELKTNIIAMFSQGGDLTSTPTLYSDKTIDWSKQKTSVIDTTVSQDYLGWDWLYSHLGFAVGKAAAIKVGISNLIASWGSVYQGELITLGDSSVKACDFIAMADSYVSMKGLMKVRKVIHSFGVDTGFITSITPGLIATSTAQNSGYPNIHKTILAWTGAIFTRSMIKGMVLKSFKYAKNAVSGTKTVNAILKTGTFSKKTFSATKTLYSAIKSGKIFVEFGKSMDAVKDAYKAAEAIKIAKDGKTVLAVARMTHRVKEVASAGKAALVIGGTEVCPIIGTIVGWVVGEVLFDIILTSIIEIWEFNNCINVFPLEYKGSYFINGAKGARHLIPGVDDVLPNADVGDDTNVGNDGNAGN